MKPKVLTLAAAGLLLLASLACSNTRVIVVTSTPGADASIPQAPTATPEPVRTDTAAPPLVSVDQVEAALSAAGWTHASFTTPSGTKANAWTLSNTYERIYTYADGEIKLEVLNTHTRQEHLETRFKLLDTVLPLDFMTALRQRNAVYDQDLGNSLPSTPDNISYPPEGAKWNEYYATYATQTVTVGSVPVTFYLFQWSLTCPSTAGCYMKDFPGQEWKGQTAFTWYTLIIHLSGNSGSPGSGT